MKEFEVFVPMLGDEPYLNSIGSNENEAWGNLSLVDISDKDLNEVVRIVRGKVVIDE